MRVYLGPASMREAGDPYIAVRFAPSHLRRQIRLVYRLARSAGVDILPARWLVADLLAVNATLDGVEHAA